MARRAISLPDPQIDAALTAMLDELVLLRQAAREAQGAPAALWREALWQIELYRPSIDALSDPAQRKRYASLLPPAL